MIPIQLELRNFLSYAEGHPPLCLEGIHVACLSGANGHGKSSLLEAMVWALWGEPRGGARAGDDLIRHGADDMSVSFEFEAGGVRYRTLRRRTRRGRSGTTELHFESWDGESWRSADGNSTADTQRLINQTLHMTHETFVHASFITQGKADAFMNLTPQQRKQVLGEILDLGQYDLLADAAREERRRAEGEVHQLDALIRNTEDELAKLEAFRERLRQAEADEARAKELADRLAAERLALLDEVGRLQNAARQAEEKTNDLRRIEDRVRSLEGQIRDLLGRLVAAQALVERAAAIEADFATYERLEAEERELGARFQPWHATHDAIRAAESAIERERARLESQLTAAARCIAELEDRQRRAPALATELEELQATLAHLEACDEQVQALRRQVAAAQEAMGAARREGERLKDAVASAEQRRSLLGEHDTCPLCGQVLGSDGLAAAQHRLDEERTMTTEQLAAARAVYAQHAQSAQQAEAQIKRLETELAGRAAAARRLGELEGAQRQLTQAVQDLQDAHELHRSLQSTLARDDFAHEARAQLGPLRERLAAINYDDERYTEVRAARDRLREAPAAMNQLHTARALLESQETQRVGLEAQHNRALAEAAEVRRAIAELQADAARLAEARAALAQKETQLQAAASVHREAVAELGEARQHVNWLIGQQQALAGHIERRKAALADVSAYTQLAEAFGKNGIQEMIIDKALPEIEDVANGLLGRLSNGRMHVTLNTQRVGRTGGTISTLDVDVSDELGTRPYELFSGGEKFRINFAIRIALSRLLARRAGVPLQMLAIDEGFGSQDREGCDRLVEAIKAIQDDFARVLVITHLDEIRDAFPVHIEVTKTHRGSTFTIT